MPIPIPPIPKHWGNLLAEEKFDSKSTFLKTTIAAVVLIPLGIFIFIAALSAKTTKNGPLPCGAAFISFIGIAAAFGALQASKRGDASVRFYQGGLLQVDKNGPLLIDYRDVQSMTYTASVGKGLADCRFGLAAKDKKFQWRGLLGHKPDPSGKLWYGHIEKAKAAMVAVIAGRMQAALAAGKNVLLTPDIELQPKGINLHKTSRFVPYAELDPPLFDVPVVAGKFELTSNGEKLLSISPESANYWPARFLLDDAKGTLRQKRT